MLNPDDEKFLEYWEANRTHEKSLFRQMGIGMGVGLLFGVGIVLSLVTGWYRRATMVANSQSTPVILVLAIVFIVIFFSVFYKRHRWELNEQRYLELKAKTDKSGSEVQQPAEIISQHLGK